MSGKKLNYPYSSKVPPVEPVNEVVPKIKKTEREMFLEKFPDLVQRYLEMLNELDKDNPIIKDKNDALSIVYEALKLKYPEEDRKAKINHLTANESGIKTILEKIYAEFKARDDREKGRIFTEPLKHIPIGKGVLRYREIAKPNIPGSLGHDSRPDYHQEKDKKIFA